jgi:hypothetical protein
MMLKVFNAFVNILLSSFATLTTSITLFLSFIHFDSSLNYFLYFYQSLQLLFSSNIKGLFVKYFEAFGKYTPLQ